MHLVRATLLIIACCTSACAQGLPEGLPRLPFHLTARPWKPLGIDRERYLDVIEGLCRFTIRHQDARGAVIDPFLKREHQYSTPYFAFAVGTLLKSGRARDLLDHGVAAMDHATECFARGNSGIPDAHGEFFLASLPAAVSLYAGQVPQEKVALWRRRLGTPRDRLIGKNTNNWRTYAMKGEWLRFELGLVERESASAFIEQSWLRATQRDRIASDAWNLYQDRGPFPESHRYGNYSGAVMIHLAEAYLARKTEIAERPAPVEVGGYAFATDERFSSAVANAGGMQMFAALKGDDVVAFDHYWTALGVERFGRVGWDSRLGPSDGIRDRQTGRGATFAPTWREGDKWVRLADIPGRYTGRFSVQFAHPLLVRCAIDYRPFKGRGPSFRHEFVVTPDGILATLRATGAEEFGVTWPLLVDDGRPLLAKVTGCLATTSYSDDGDEEAFFSVIDSPAVADDELLRSTYGWLRPVRVAAADGVNHTFVYPRNAGDPPAEKVRHSFRLAADGFESRLGAVHGTLYAGRTSAGGEGTSIDCDRDGNLDAFFSTPCQFVLQLRDGKITAVEADRKVTARLDGKTIALEAYVPAVVVP